MAYRQSTSIGYKGAQSIYYGAREVASYINHPLNTLVTINFASTKVNPTDCSRVFSKIRINRFNKWARRPAKDKGTSFEPTYLYVFENVSGQNEYTEIGDGLPHNVHVHWYMHIPPKRRFDFENRLYEWLEVVAGRIEDAEAISVEDVSEDNGVATYCLKGAKEQVAKRFGAENVQKPQGIIVGKRTGVSVNIGPKARREMDQTRGIDRRSRLRRAA